MTYLFDTNACIDLMKLRDPLMTRARALGPGAIAVSTVTLAELWFGAHKSARPIRTRAEQDAFLAPFRVLDFDARAADRYASSRARLARAGTPIGDRDLMISAIALANARIVVTRNVGEFSRVTGLDVEDWMA